jgi:hypothetical protein
MTRTRRSLGSKAQQMKDRLEETIPTLFVAEIVCENLRDLRTVSSSLRVSAANLRF